MKKTALMGATAILAIALSACSGGASENTDSAASDSASQTQAAVPNLEGTWKQTNSQSDDSYQEAVIEGDTITINWVSNNGDTKDLYWAGTFEAPTADGEYKWTSNNDHEQTDEALMASEDDTKEFTYKDGEISYEASALGSTTTVRMEKQ